MPSFRFPPILTRLTTYLLLIGTLGALAAFGATSATASSTKTVTQTMVIVGHSLGAKGSDGLRHDTTLGASFAVPQGSQVTVTVYNYDEGPHTITAPKLGLNVRIPGAKDEKEWRPGLEDLHLHRREGRAVPLVLRASLSPGQGFGDMKSPSTKIGFIAGHITVTA